MFCLQRWLPLARHKVFDVSVIVSTRSTSRVDHDGEKLVVDPTVPAAILAILIAGFHQTVARCTRRTRSAAFRSHVDTFIIVLIQKKKEKKKIILVTKFNITVNKLERNCSFDLLVH